MNFYSMLWPNFRTKALTFSYDDGVMQDKRLIGIFNKYGLKATFNVNSGFIGQDDWLMHRDVAKIHHAHVGRDEFAEVYKGHEVAVHTVFHPLIAKLPFAQTLEQILDDRRTLEELVGYPVRGMAYPSNSVSDDVERLVRNCGIVYARVVPSTNDFSLPKDPLYWQCSCHHESMQPLVEPFLADGDDLRLFSVWGHAYELDYRGWQRLEDYCARLGGHDDVWYATNIEIFDYINAYKGLVSGVDGSVLLNKSALDVFIRDEDGRKMVVPAGGVLVVE